MAKHEKFVFEELQEDLVVNNKNQGVDNGLEDFINNAVVAHIKKIVTVPESFNNSLESFDQQDIQAEEVLEETSSFEQDATQSTDDNTLIVKNQDPSQSIVEHGNEKIVDDSLEMSKIHEEKLDIDQIKSDSFQSGYAHAKDEYEAKLQAANDESAIFEKLMEKLSIVVPEVDLNLQVAKLSAESITSIAKKLHLTLPVNFEEILRKGLIEKLDRFYKEGKITVTVHPERYEFCSHILQSDTIPAKFKNNFSIIKDDKLSKDDCLMEWQETRLEYNTEQLSEEINRIVERLTNAA